MTEQPQYIPIAKAAFNFYLDGHIDLDTLLERLREMELQVQSEEEEETGKQVWFRFFSGDPLKTTISDIEKELSDPAHPNSLILKRGIALGLEADELEVHYS